MRRVIIFLLLLSTACTAVAQRVSRDYRDCPMTTVLTDLSRVSPRQRIVFIYNDLEDYLVTQRFNSLTVAEAIVACIGHYPIKLTNRGDSILLVDCTQRLPYKVKGLLVNEQGQPVADANISLTAGEAACGQSISNQSGRFVIPTSQPEGTIHVSHVAYKPASLRFSAGDLGTIRLETANIRLDSVSVKASVPTLAESRYLKYADRIAKEVWQMKMPQFHIDTLPAKYRHADAVVLADYDCIEYQLVSQSYPGMPFTLVNIHEKWVSTLHLHRSRYYVNSPEAARRLSAVSYSLQTDITDVTFHKTTVMGIRVISPDGSTRTVNTWPYFKPRARSRATAANTTDTIRLARLEPGDILDVFIYHRFEEPMSPYELKLPARYPVLYYEGRAVADRKLHLMHRETGTLGHKTTEENDGRDVIVYTQSDYDQPPATAASVTVEVNLKK